ncbi:hypothetical protein [Azospirillum sp. TSA6c]|uniref:hypothetical protein n=1 Tax=unclassified Azospirillum TaxID=2630922 RepID=UPI000D6181B1|nr:hypothetical protein [Azospirillum sp. TSA6c]PWC47375.1 hypothetical protein TSA6c_12145 [Azospirillum sp. TSA6c]
MITFDTGFAGPDIPLAQSLMTVLGIDERRLSPDYWGAIQDAGRLCPVCADRGRCRAALADSTAALSYMSFCPNADLLGELEAAAAGGLVTDRA